MDKCIVCGCTQERACPGGCGWFSYNPPICTCCVEPFAFAALWHFVDTLEPAASPDTAKHILWLRKNWKSFVAASATSDNSVEGDRMIPTQRRVRTIARRFRKMVKR